MQHNPVCAVIGCIHFLISMECPCRDFKGFKISGAVDDADANIQSMVGCLLCVQLGSLQQPNSPHDGRRATHQRRKSPQWRPFPESALGSHESGKPLTESGVWDITSVHVHEGTMERIRAVRSKSSMINTRKNFVPSLSGVAMTYGAFISICTTSRNSRLSLVG